jgi:hypothetical protein
MSPSWHEAIEAAIPRPVGALSATDAVVAWATMPKGDQRMALILDARDDAIGGEHVARALRSGGWSGAGLRELADMLSTEEGRQALAAAYVAAREAKGAPR